MTSAQLNRSTSVEEVFRDLATAIELLVQRAGNGSVSPEQWRRADEILEALPLSSYEFSLARRRLGNARMYLHEGEKGAASFELKLLQGQVASLSDAFLGDNALPMRRLRINRKLRGDRLSAASGRSTGRRRSALS